mgnify:CR=1 FL=1
MTDVNELPERESMEFDVVIVGAGPAGLSAAIRLKQVNPELTVVVLEKGGEVGAHILSGAVVDPIGIDKLIPDWRDDPDHPFKTPVKADHFLVLGPAGSVKLPNFLMPPLMNNHGNFIVSLSNVTKWLGDRAEALGVEIYPGFSATEVLTNDEGAVIGVATGDMGVERNGEPDEGREPQKYGIGLKELWQVKPEHSKPGLVQHSFGWPLDLKTGGGSFLYHLEDNQVAVGFVVHLNYKNPWLSPFEEFQRFKTHAAIAPVFEGAKRLGYGARAISEGGWQSVPKLAFPGGALIGCSAGFVNVARIKGSHNAVLSGMMAAEHAAEAIAAGRAQDTLDGYDGEWRTSEIGKDLKRVRNVKPLWSKLGTIGGVALGGLDMWLNTLFGISPFGTMSHGKPDYAALEPAAQHKKIDYPKPDGVLTFDRLSSVFLSNTNHEENEPVHLQVKDLALQKTSELEVYGGPSSRYCPAGVYEWVETDGVPTFVINAQNCVHCKTCDIKDPNQNINWVPPQGGEGPVYTNM